MSTDNMEMTSRKQMYLLDELLGLLESQIQLAHQGISNDKEFKSLIKKTASIVDKLSRSKILESTEFKNQREQLRKLYEDLCLTLTAQQAETVEELKRVRKGRKTIEAYCNNL